MDAGKTTFLVLNVDVDYDGVVDKQVSITNGSYYEDRDEIHTTQGIFVRVQ